MKVAIVDYGMGNLHSVLKSVQFARESHNQKIQIFLTSDADQVKQADKIIFPGQGAMPNCMAALHQSGLGESIKEGLKHKPFLGICVGAQLLFDSSEEGNTAGLGWFSGQVKCFAADLCDEQSQQLKVPHMGWNQVYQSQKHPLFKQIDQNEWFYFVHSYFFAPQQTEITLGCSHYGHDFTCVVGHENVFAAQFHVEKSHHAGLQLLSNFLSWDGGI